jgi:hypothetical protein
VAIRPRQSEEVELVTTVPALLTAAADVFHPATQELMRSHER